MLASKNYSQLIKILKIFNDEKIINEIISPYLDYKALEKLFDILDKINFIPDLLLKIVIIFVENFQDLKKYHQHQLRQ